MGSLGIVIGAGFVANEDNDIKVFGGGLRPKRQRNKGAEEKAFACLFKNAW